MGWRVIFVERGGRGESEGFFAQGVRSMFCDDMFCDEDNLRRERRGVSYILLRVPLMSALIVFGLAN